MHDFLIVCDCTHKKKHQISKFNDKTKQNLPLQAMEEMNTDKNMITKG